MQVQTLAIDYEHKKKPFYGNTRNGVFGVFKPYTML